MSDEQTIAKEVEESYARIRAADERAFAGFVMDEACLAVGRRRGMSGTDVLRVYRKFHPRPAGFTFRPIPVDARSVSDEAKALA